jgi:polysaccharide export outer membrane protein
MSPNPRQSSFLAGAAVALLLCATAIAAPKKTEDNAAAAQQGVNTAGIPAQQTNYRLSANDLLSIAVFQEDDLTTTVRISKDGTINFPLIGIVKIGDKTAHEAARVIEDLLAKDYLVNPQVTLTVLEFSKRKFTILGQVMKPNTYDMPDDSTLNLLQAIGLAGGYTRIANPSKITLKRQEGSRETVYKLDAKSMARSESIKRFEVLPGDTITVGESLF